jgi:hypothetical protein
VEQTYRGKARYRTLVDEGQGTLIVAVECLIEGAAASLWALFDTGSEWSVFPASLVQSLGYSLTEGEPARMSTRYGAVEGYLVRLPLVFVAEEGSSLEMEATVFVSPDWAGPFVIGWRGCIERMQYAMDPNEDTIYFSPL